MTEITCVKCGSTDYSTEQKSNNLVARCNACGSFIKNLPHDKPRFYVGRHKGKPIEDIDDLSYLEWASANLELSSRQKDAVTDRIHDLQFLMR